ncbi:MAG: hypothetical protein ACREL5_05580 [Gemmatimonadales bacterium]
MTATRVPARLRHGSAVAVLALIAGGCTPAFPSPPMPLGLTPVDRATAAAWAVSTDPEGHQSYRFHWTLTDERHGSGGGRGSALIAAPDSLRFDFRAALGAGAGAAAVVGDTALWAEPEDQVHKLVPSYPLLWAMIGIAMPPGAGWRAEGHRDARVTAWRYVRGADTVEYVWQGPEGTDRRPVLSAYVSQAGKPVGKVITIYDSTRKLIRSRLDVLANPARLVLDFDRNAKPITFGAEDWRAPSDQ